MTDTPYISSESAASEAVENEALAWLAQLDGGSLTAKDLAAFQEWINRSPAHAVEVHRLNSLWGELNELTDMIGPIAQADYVSSQLRKRPKHQLWKTAAILTISMFVFAGGFSALKDINSSNVQVKVIETAEVKLPLVYKTRIGEKQEHTLDDGSVITLNTGSRLEIDFRKDQRRVRLLQGEVLFDVVHDTSRPFLVFAGEGLVRAVGTAFVVRLNDNDLVDVIVSEGAVELSTVLAASSDFKPDAVLTNISSMGIIKAGHSATFEHMEASIAAVSEKEMQAKLSWKEGILTFSGETLDEVIREVSRYTELEIQFKDKSLMGLQFGGVFEAGDTEVLFATLKTDFDIDIDTSRTGVVTLARTPL